MCDNKVYNKPEKHVPHPTISFTVPVIAYRCVLFHRGTKHFTVFLEPNKGTHCFLEHFKWQ